MKRRESKYINRRSFIFSVNHILFFISTIFLLNTNFLFFVLNFYSKYYLHFCFLCKFKYPLMFKNIHDACLLYFD